MDAPAHDGLLHGEAGRDRGERENESGTHHREVTCGWRRGRGLASGLLGGKQLPIRLILVQEHTHTRAHGLDGHRPCYTSPCFNS